MNLLVTPRGRTVLFTCLYASEGAPIGFLWWALPTLLRTRGVEIERITSLLALLVLPWTCKFLWAPAVDALAAAHFGFRGWVLCAQTVMALALLPLAWLDPVDALGLVRVLLLVHAFAAATQDVAVDGLAVQVLAGSERGEANGAMQAGMLLGRSLFGGGALVVADRIGWNGVLFALVAAIGASLVLVAGIHEPPRERSSVMRPQRALRDAFARRTTWIGLAFALVSAAGFEAVGALAGPFLVDRGFDDHAIGLFLGVPVVAVMAIGGLIGGRIADRFGRLRTLVVATCGFVVPILVIAGTERVHSDAGAHGLVLVPLLCMYAFVGVFVAASYALFMDLTDPRVGATQFSAFMAATNACESWSTWAGGRIVSVVGYPTAFATLGAVSLLGLPLLRPLRREATSARGDVGADKTSGSGPMSPTGR